MPVLAAVAFVWLGMVLAISFLEAPLKFRAPGVTVPLGLGIGRLVFRALNAVELVALLVVAGVLVAGPRPGGVVAAATAAAGTLVLQLVAVRPALTRRADAVLAGADAPRSRAHLAYVALEAVKVLALGSTGSTALAAVAGAVPA